MDERDPAQPETTLERVGLALGLGGLSGGVFLTVVGVASGSVGTLGIVAALLLGSLLAGLALTAIAAPIWLVLHWSGRRGFATAVTTGALIGFVLFLFAQTYGFGLFDPPIFDAATWAMRWLSAAAVSLMSAGIAGVIAALMWVVAYRVR